MAARRDDQEVVRHDVRILEDELNRLARFHHEAVDVEAHLLDERLHDDGGDAEFPQALAEPGRVAGGSSEASSVPNCTVSMKSCELRWSVGTVFAQSRIRSTVTLAASCAQASRGRRRAARAAAARSCPSRICSVRTRKFAGGMLRAHQRERL